MGTGRRSLTAATLVLACAFTVLATSAAAHASIAAPTPDPSPSAPTTPSPAPTPLSLKKLEAVQKQLDRLYHDAAVATDAYNAAEEKSRHQSAEIVDLSREIVKGRVKIEQLKARAGAAARAQYRTGGLPPEARLWLSENPGAFLEGADRIRQGQKATKGLLGELARAQEDLEQYTEDATAQWKKLEANRKAKADAKKKVTQQIAAAKKVESELEDEEKKRLAKLEEETARKAQDAWLGSGALDGAPGAASANGEQAVTFALAQMGKPYEWGAEGPETYDCSGLTSQAWLAAGRTIPRTSQEQWRQLPRVDVKDMRPGDLIIYFDDASHVAMYIGDGEMVHAPRPGRNVTVAGAGSMPILGVVRPDK